MQNSRALNRFIENVGNINAYLAEIQEAADAHFGLQPDDVTWADAELSDRVLVELSAVAIRLRRRLGAD